MKKTPHFLKVRRAVRTNLDKDTHYIVGVSGGADSLALVAAMAVEGYEFKAVVIDHQLQDDHEEFSLRAKNLSLELGATDVEIVKVEVPETGRGMESDARDARYQQLFSYGYPVVTAHTMNDQAETVLLSMCQRNGINSVTGMRVVTKGDSWKESGKPFKIIRPLINTVKRQDTVSTCEEIGVTPWNDPHNEDEKYRRVALRKSIIPQLNDIFGHDITSHLCNTAKDAQLYKEYVSRDVESSYQKYVQYQDNKTVLSVELGVEEEIVVTSVVSRFLEDHGLTTKRATVNSVSELITQWRGQKGVSLPFARVYRKDGFIHIE